MRRSVRLGLALAALLVAAAGSAAFTPVSVMLQWTPQSQFAGFYAAYEQGFYLRKGLDVLILRGGPDRNTLDTLKNRKADFVTMFLPTAVVQRAQGLPLVHVGQFVNRSSLVLVARRDRGIGTPEDLRGRRVSIWGEAFEVPYRAFFDARSISVDFFPQNYSVNLFLRGGVDACCAMYYNEYHLLRQAGFDDSELLPFFLRDYGFGFPEDGLYCLDTLFREKPEICKAFFEATMEGWRYAKEHPEETLDYVMKYVRQARVPTNRTHMRWMLETILPGILPDSGDVWKPGVLTEAEYRRTAEILKNADLISWYPPFVAFRGGVSADVR